jgi:hypothetical protein
MQSVGNVCNGWKADRTLRPFSAAMNSFDRSPTPPAGDKAKERPYWFAMAVVIALAVGAMVRTYISAERLADRCEAYAEEHRILPNQVVNCPFD